MATIVRVDMTTLTAERTPVPQTTSQLGGRAMCTAIIAAEVSPTCHPLSAANKLVIAPGLLAGSGAPNSGRLSIGAKSPLTQGIKEANVGGTAARELARLGIKAVVIEGSPPPGKCYIVILDTGGASILEAPEIADFGNYAAAEWLRRTYGPKVGLLSIGPAGMHRMAAASIAATDPQGRPSRHAARGGLGAVMGAKGVKAVVIDSRNTQAPQPADKMRFQEVCRRYTREIRALKATQLLSQFGTVGGLAYLSKIGALPTRNYRDGSFEGSDQIGGKGVAARNAERGGSFGHVCMPGCVVRCSNVMHDRAGNFLTAGFEYESAAMLGANLGIDDLDAVMAMEKMCDDFGIDTMETGAALGVAAEAGLFAFGDAPRALALVSEIGQATVLGRILGQGAQITARVFGISRVPVVKGQAVPAHDPRAEIGTGIGYASSPQGADHTGIIIFKAESLAEMTALSRQKQMNTCAYDSVGLCQMAEPTPAVMASLISSFFGWPWNEADVSALGRMTLHKEVAFNRRAGLGPETDRLPDFFKQEKRLSHDGVFDVEDSVVQEVLTNDGGAG